jgi:DNA relaxase NicK
MKNELINNINKIHTTALGIVRIKRNLELETVDVVSWCKRKIKKANDFYKKGKNWYVSAGDLMITINAHSYTIITAHRKRFTSLK